MQIYRAPTSEDRDEALRSDDGHLTQYRVYIFHGLTYIWPLPGGSVPTDVGLSWNRVELDCVPAAVPGKALLDAVFRRLLESGFDEIPTRPPQPISFFRRQRNLLRSAIPQLPGEESGVYPVVQAQSYPLSGDRAVPGGIGLMLDLRTVNSLELTLEELYRARLDLNAMQLIWKHQPGCDCDIEERKGFAGWLQDTLFPKSVKVLIRGSIETLPAGCLAPRVSRHLLEQYVSHVLHRSPSDIHATLDQQLSEFWDPSALWHALLTLRQQLNGLEVFPGVHGMLQDAMQVGGLPSDGTVAPFAPPALRAPLLNFRYGAQQTAENPGAGLNRYGPYDRFVARRDSLKTVILSPQAYAAHAKILQTALLNGVKSVKSFRNRFHLTTFDVQLRVFNGQDADSYRQAAAELCSDSPDAVFLITREADKYSPYLRDPYRSAKAVLVAHNVPVQGIEVESLTVPESTLQWTISGLGVATYAKVGNIPYVLSDPNGTNELVLGIGRSDVYSQVQALPKRMFGVAAVFRQDGDFLFAGSTTPVSDEDRYEDNLADLLVSVMGRYQGATGAAPTRLTLHVFKKTGHREMSAVERALEGTGIEFALVHVNRDSPLWIVDDRRNNLRLPERGVVVELAERDWLLVTGAGRQGDRHPLRIALDDRSTFTDMNRIVEQVYGFTAVSWRTLTKSREPVTITYGRLLAHEVGKLTPYGLPADYFSGGLTERPWFL